MFCSYVYSTIVSLKNTKLCYYVLNNTECHCEVFLYCLIFSCSLGRLDWFGIKVAFSIHRGLLLHVRGVAGIHIVRRDGSCYGTEAGHGDLEELCIIFLEFG